MSYACSDSPRAFIVSKIIILINLSDIKKEVSVYRDFPVTATFSGLSDNRIIMYSVFFFKYIVLNIFMNIYSINISDNSE